MRASVGIRALGPLHIKNFFSSWSHFQEAVYTPRIHIASMVSVIRQGMVI